jgi:UDPglucose--hexose-1-phosphate uridylyltransferase
VLNLRQHPHRRFNPLRNEWVIVSPQRNERPWQGTVDVVPDESQVAYDAKCYLCPGNTRDRGDRNPEYASTFVFDNDFPAVSPTSPALSSGHHDLLVAETERGVCRVVCFSPRHDLTLARMDIAAIRAVVETWVDEYAALVRLPGMAYATIFENRGAMMGASNPHPHGQIWATEHEPNDPAMELAALSAYRARRGSCLLCDYVALELATQERVVCDNDGFVALVPFWAAWPFETLVISRRHVGELPSLDEHERGGLADILKQLTTRYDNVFETAFPYSMGFHQQPFHGAPPDAHLHAHFYPPLLRSATVRKFMVGFEMLGSPQRDFTPEDAAQRMQAVSAVHYRERSQAGASR